ncbi:MAG: hypothetical protein LBQ82_08375 [Treponema sp.]|jgi:hypothetical protein|nr:hypothetical protein [Treponema sp.]
MKKNFDIKDAAILFGWITGLLFLIALIWVLTQPLLAHNVLRAVNGSFIAAGDSRRVSGYIKNSGKKTELFGYWYTMYNSTDKMFVFAVFRDGILVPLGAVVSDNGRVDDVIPLSAHAVQVFDKLPQSVIQIYVARIESSSPAYTEGKNQ